MSDVQISDNAAREVDIIKFDGLFKSIRILWVASTSTSDFSLNN